MKSLFLRKVSPALLFAALLAQNGWPQQGNAPGAAERLLQAAQEKLQICLTTEKRARAEFEALKRSGKAAEAVIRDYEIYLNRIEALVAENRRVVAELQAAMTMPAGAAIEPGADDPRADQTALLDRQLDQALSAFDEMLLKEMDLIKAQSASKMTGLAEEAAAAAERLRRKGIEIDTSGSQRESNSKEPAEEEGGATDNAEPSEEESSARAETGTAGRDQGAAAQSETAANGAKQAGGEAGGDTGISASQDPSSAYSEDDDDIVARQLREAAENETDPELKRRLWKEYEAYTQNTRR